MKIHLLIFSSYCSLVIFQCLSHWEEVFSFIINYKLTYTKVLDYLLIKAECEKCSPDKKNNNIGVFSSQLNLLKLFMKFHRYFPWVSGCSTVHILNCIFDRFLIISGCFTMAKLQNKIWKFRWIKVEAISKKSLQAKVAQYRCNLKKNLYAKVCNYGL